MRNWYDRTKAAGAELIGDEGFIVNEAASDDDLAKLKELAAKLGGGGTLMSAAGTLNGTLVEAEEKIRKTV